MTTRNIPEFGMTCLFCCLEVLTYDVMQQYSMPIVWCPQAGCMRDEWAGLMVMMTNRLHVSRQYYTMKLIKILTIMFCIYILCTNSNSYVHLHVFVIYFFDTEWKKHWSNLIHFFLIVYITCILFIFEVSFVWLIEQRFYLLTMNMMYWTTKL